MNDGGPSGESAELQECGKKSLGETQMEFDANGMRETGCSLRSASTKTGICRPVVNHVDPFE